MHNTTYYYNSIIIVSVFDIQLHVITDDLMSFLILILILYAIKN